MARIFSSIVLLLLSSSFLSCEEAVTTQGGGVIGSSFLSCEEAVTTQGGGVIAKNLKAASEAVEEPTARVKPATQTTRHATTNFSLSNRAAVAKRESISKAFGLESIPENAALTCLCSYNRGIGKVSVKCKLPMQSDWKTIDDRSTAKLNTPQCTALCNELKAGTAYLTSDESIKTIWLKNVCK